MTENSRWQHIGSELDRLLAEMALQDQQWAEAKRGLLAGDEGVQLVFRELPDFHSSPGASAPGGIRG